MQAVNGFGDLINQFINGNILYVLSIIGGLMYVCKLEKEQQKRVIFSLVIIILTILNPISFEIIGKKIGYTAEYYRFLWVIPFELLLAYFVYEAMRQLENIKQRLILVLIICALVLLQSVNVEELRLPENAYQISNDVIEVSDILDELMEVEGKEDVTIIGDMLIVNQIRQYNGNIKLIYAPNSIDANRNDETHVGLMSMLMYNRADLSAEAIEKIQKTHEIDYIVVNSINTTAIAYMQQLNWKIVGWSTSYMILEAPK